jgi:glycosyltransferase 2 family protein
LKSVLRKLYLSIGLGAAVFLGFSIYLDAGLLLEAFGRFDWSAGLVALVLAAFNYVVRFWRWHLYLAHLNVSVPKLDNFRIFLSGLALSVTPGKAGELLKAYLVRTASGAPIGLGISAVFTERLTDFVALLLLSVVGIYSLKEGLWTLIVAAGGTATLFLVIFIPGAIPYLLGLLSKFPGLHRVVDPARDAYTSARRLLAPAQLVKGLTLGVTAWMSECLGFYYVIKGFGGDVELATATFIYAFATIFGALTLLPGGIGTTEGSMTGLLTLQGVPLVDAAAATFVIRACTLWFAVGIGAIVLVTSAVERDALAEMETNSDAE